MSTEFGARLRLVSGPETTCDGELSVYRWVFDPARMDLPELARTVGRAYVTADMMLAYPQARLSDKVPQSASVRKGDFGEFIAQGLYSTRMGRDAASGVIDRDLRLFAMPQVQLLSTAAFPTGGGANPTMTLFLLALRCVAQHLSDTARS